MLAITSPPSRRDKFRNATERRNQIALLQFGFGDRYSILLDRRIRWLQQFIDFERGNSRFGRLSDPFRDSRQHINKQILADTLTDTCTIYTGSVPQRFMLRLTESSGNHKHKTFCCTVLEKRSSGPARPPHRKRRYQPLRRSPHGMRFGATALSSRHNLRGFP